LMEVVTLPELEIPVKPPEVAEEVVPRIILLLMLKFAGAEEFTKHTIVVVELAPPTLVLRIVLLLMFIVDVFITYVNAACKARLPVNYYYFSMVTVIDPVS